MIFFYHNSRTPLTSITDSILNTPVLHNHYHNQFAEIQERTKIYGMWKRAIKMEEDMPPYTHAEHPSVGSKQGRDEELAEGTGSGKTCKKGRKSKILRENESIQAGTRSQPRLAP